jgi:predicted PurR-regulated permease PerM
MKPDQRDLAQNTLGVLFIGGLIASSFWILQPFLAATIWATMVVVATWPAMIWIQGKLWGKRSLAVLLMTLILLMVLVVPLSLAIIAIADSSDRIAGWVNWLSAFKMPPPPDWVAELPLVGTKLQGLWQQFTAQGIQDFASRLEPYAGTVTQWLISEAGNFGLLFVQFLLIVIISAIMYAGGEPAADWVKRFGHRLGGERGVRAVELGGKAIRGVAMGVVITAVAQSVLGGIGLAIVGVPMAAVLTALMFMLCLAQLGPMLVLLPAVAWVYWNGDTGWGTFLLVWSLGVISLDNILRPYLIKKGADLPLLLIFAGVIGGLVAFGLIGIFVGPVVLAVAYTLIDDWVAGGTYPEQQPAKPD